MSLIGRTIRGYRIIEEVGRGGYGIVYRAYQESVDREVAIKVILPEFASKPEFASRFKTEAHLVAQLEHLHILPLFDYWQDEEDGAFLVMRYLRGGSMRDRLDESGALSLKDAVQVLDQVLTALEFAHQRGIIHRDIKPDNMLLDDLGNLFLSDFGVAKAVGTSNSTADGTVVGTIAYLSPEQLRGEETTAQSDIYSVGILIYELLVGEHPFPNIPIGKMVMHQIHDPLPLVQDKKPDINPEVDTIIQRATLKDADLRYESVEDLRLKLRELVETAPRHTTITLEREAYSEVVASTRQARNRHNMLDKIDSFWIKGVLENSLHGALMIELEMQQANRVASNTTPFGYRLDRLTNTLQNDSNSAEIATWLNRDVVEVFDDLQGQMLILGDPGGGKTTTLLTLARALLVRANVDEGHPIPVVFNLSSWNEDGFDSLEHWLQVELRNRYQVPPRVAEKWVKNDELILLLDALDEVPEIHRESCVVAINQFKQTHSFVDVVVCSRLRDYKALTESLDFGGVLSLQPLTDEQVNDYLVRLGRDGVAVRQLLEHEASLRQMSTNPLMLSILTMAFIGGQVDPQQVSANLQQDGSLRDGLFGLYVHRMFERRMDAALYTREKVEEWLQWLAMQMQQNGQSLLQVELIQPHWLGNTTRIWAYRLLVGLVSGTIASLLASLMYIIMFAWRDSFDTIYGRAITFVPIVFAIVSVVAVLRLIIKPTIAPVDDLKWSTRAALQALPRHLVVAAVIVVLLTLDRSFDLLLVNFTGWYAALAYLLAFGMLSGFVAEQVDSKTIPNEGLRRSFRNALHVPIILMIAVFVPMSLEFEFNFSAGLEFAPIVAVAFGVVFGPLNPGGEFVVQHLVLRLLLWLGGKMPVRYVRFLNYASSLIFMRKVGGGYVFIHRYLLEYFAGEANDAAQAKHSTPVSPSALNG